MMMQNMQAKNGGNPKIVKSNRPGATSSINEFTNELNNSRIGAAVL
jgi:hypothetical protein